MEDQVLSLQDRIKELEEELSCARKVINLARSPEVRRANRQLDNLVDSYDKLVLKRKK